MADLFGIKRVSRDNNRSDSDNGSYHSPFEQVDSCEAWAKANGHRIVHWFDESDSVSGKTVERKELQKAVAGVLADEADGIIVMKVDRLARDMIGGLLAVRELENNGKVFIAVKDGIYGDGSELSQLILAVLLWMAEWYLKSVTKGWEDVTRRRVANGVHTAEPYGYRKDGVPGPNGKLIGTRRLVSVPDEEDWVVGMFERRAEAPRPDGTTGPMAWAKIADWLNEGGIRTREGGLWGINSVRRLVQSRVYLGEITSGEFVNLNAHKGIVSLDLWQRANAHNRNVLRNDEATYKLTSIIRCTGCGVTMRGVGTKNAYGHYRYYDCRRNHTFGKCPAPARIRADVIEAAVEEVFRTKFLGPCCDRFARGEVSTDALEAALLEQETAEAELREFLVSDSTIEMGRVLGKSWVEDGQQARLARVMEAREAVAEARNAVLGVALPVNLSEIWETLGIEERRAFLADAFEVIAVQRGGEFRIWTRNDPSVPRDLPGRDGTRCLTPIAMDNAPAGTGEAAA